MQAIEQAAEPFVQVSYARQIFRLLHPPHSRQRGALMLAGYFDDSGTHAGSLVVAVGGCVAREEQWLEFTAAWKEALDSEGVRAFHATDLASGYGDFTGWDQARKQRFIQALAAVMKRYAKTAIAGLVIAQDYDSVIPEWALKSAAFGDKYNFCFQMCVGLAMAWAEGLNPPMPKDDQLAFIFDQQPKREGLTRDSYHAIKTFRDADDKMGSLTFADGKRFLPLQAADFIAYEAYKHLDNFIRQSGRPMRGSLRVLTEGDYQFDARYFSREKLEALVESYSREEIGRGSEPWWPWQSPADLTGET
jgi:Protein of unknown function (DUF3800)